MREGVYRRQTELLLGKGDDKGRTSTAEWNDLNDELLSNSARAFRGRGFLKSPRSFFLPSETLT